MSEYKDGSYQCLPGPALIAKVLAGRCKMHYTRATVGKGTIPEGVSPKSLTEPPDYVMEAQIAAVTNPVDGECQVTVQLNSSDVETGFYAMGIMLYAQDPDLGEVPYTYLKLEEGLEWIRPASSAVGKLATFDLIAAVGDIDAVSANIDPDAIATYAAVRQLIANSTVVKEITIPRDGWQDSQPATATPGGEEGEGEIDRDREDVYGLHLDIPIEGVTEEMLPFLIVHPAHLDTARTCEFANTARTMSGAIRVYSKTAPSNDMLATLVLLCSSTNVFSGGGGGGDSSYVLPAATATRLGGVKIGSGLRVEPDGTASVNWSDMDETATAAVAEKAAERILPTEEEVDQMLDETFQPYSPNP